MKTIIVIQARMGSTRLPGKVMADLGGQPVLAWCVRACRYSQVGEVIVATTTQPADQAIVDWCSANHVQCVRGSESDVLSRFVVAAEYANADVILRVTGDEPFIDPYVIGLVARRQQQTHAQYCTNIHPRTFPDGCDVEAFTITALTLAERNATRNVDRDTVTYWMMRNAHLLKQETVINPIPGMEGERWVLDTEKDMEFCREIARLWKWSYGPPSMLDMMRLLDNNPEIRDINKDHIMNERFFESLSEEEPYERRVEESQEMLKDALEIIPLGAQTFSKSHIQFPGGKSPLFVSHGKGAYIYDVDGNEYVDLVSGLLPVILGYCDPDVDEAIRAQLSKGISFSLATELELDLAWRIRNLLPSVDMVRFGKNGSDATSAAVRLARAFTQRDHVLNCGYHGWPDVFIGGDNLRGRGVPDGVSGLTTHIRYGDLDHIYGELTSRNYACIIVEPETDQGFLQKLREVCDHTDTLLIFDEIITWPRWGMGGAQKRFNVKPDLTTISKALANGMPISAIGGRRDIMKLMEPPNNIFFSGTFQGETLSLAAAIATIDKLERENVIEKMAVTNTLLDGKILSLAKRYDVPVVFSYGPGGCPGLTRISFQDYPGGRGGGATREQLAILFRQSMARNGTLIIASNNLSHAHGMQEVKRIVQSYEASFRFIAQCLEAGTVGKEVGEAQLTAADVRKAGQDY